MKRTGYPAVVTAEGDGTVSLWAKPNAKSEVIAHVPVGAEALVLLYNPDSEWCRVEVNGKIGLFYAGQTEIFSYF